MTAVAIALYAPHSLMFTASVIFMVGSEEEKWKINAFYCIRTCGCWSFGWRGLRRNGSKTGLFTRYKRLFSCHPICQLI